jgi:hypothetical protein
MSHSPNGVRARYEPSHETRDNGPIGPDPENGGDLREEVPRLASAVGVLADSHAQSVGLREPGRQRIFRVCD